MEGRYWLFAGDNFYPLGGVDDVVLTSDNLEDCRKKAFTGGYGKEYDWWHILDVKTGRVTEGRRAA